MISINLITVIVVLFIFWCLTLFRLAKVERQRNILKARWQEFVEDMEEKHKVAMTATEDRFKYEFKFYCPYLKAIDEEIESWD